MTQISRDDVLNLAQLSQLQVSDSEADGLAADITRILGYVEQLDELDTSDAEPTYQVTDLHNIWRDDMVVPSTVSREDLLELSPGSAKNQIKVPRVL